MFLCAGRLPSCAPRARASRGSRNQNAAGNHTSERARERARAAVVSAKISLYLPRISISHGIPLYPDVDIANNPGQLRDHEVEERESPGQSERYAFRDALGKRRASRGAH